MRKRGDLHVCRNAAKEAAQRISRLAGLLDDDDVATLILLEAESVLGCRSEPESSPLIDSRRIRANQFKSLREPQCRYPLILKH